MTRGPPGSPLFPYTTLFRSLAPRQRDLLRAVIREHIASARPVASITDRKSTRLNSSHDQISYAVFCLKKKSGQELQQDAALLAYLGGRGRVWLARSQFSDRQ